MLIEFYVRQTSNDFVGTSSNIVVQDNIHWEDEMIENFIELLSEFYDVSRKQIEINKKPGQ